MSLTNFELSIKEYIAGMLQEKYPEISIQDGSPLSDLLINTHIELLKPILSQLSRVTLMQDLSNAESMSPEDLDNIGINNYGVARREGTKASGYVYVQVPPENIGSEAVVIGPIVAKSSTQNIYSTDKPTIIRHSLTETPLVVGTVVPGVVADYLNPSNGVYEFPVFVEAEEVGTSYNCDSGDINVLVVDYPLLTDVVFNKDAFINGSDTETNAQYVPRIINGSIDKSVGTYKGYKNYILSNFDNVEDVFIVGSGDDNMLRDKILVRENGLNVEKAIGGKVDIYVKGENIQNYSQLAYVKSDKIRLEFPLLKTQSSIVVHNKTNPSNNDLAVQLTYENPDTLTGWVDVKVVAGASEILPSIDDELEIRYISFMDETLTDTLLCKQILYYKSNKIKIVTNPIRNITQIQNLTTSVDVPLLDTFTLGNESTIIERGTFPVQTGVPNTAVKLDPTIAINSSDYYTDSVLTILSGPGAGQSLSVDRYDLATNLLHLTTPLATQPNNTSTYKIVSNKNNLKYSAKDTTTLSLNIGSGYFNIDDTLALNYTYNAAVSDIQYDLDINENRVVTTDVLVFDAPKIYIYMAFKVKCLDKTTITAFEKQTMYAAVEDILDSIKFEGKIQLSDIISNLYQNKNVTSFLDYVQMPPVFYSSTDYTDVSDETIFALTDPAYFKSEIILTGPQYPVAGKVAVAKL